MIRHNQLFRTARSLRSRITIGDTSAVSLPETFATYSVLASSVIAGRRPQPVVSISSIRSSSGDEVVWNSFIVCNANQRTFSTSAGSKDFDNDNNNQYVSTKSGLQYLDVIVGQGESPNDGETVRVHYTGKLEDGTEFDSSHNTGIPIDFSVGIGQVISGWDEGIETMKVGGKRKLIVPPHLGYGHRNMGAIPPGSTLYFDCELVKIVETEGVLDKIKSIFGRFF